MASQIDPTEPPEGLATTAAVRQNFSYSKSEIEALQAKDAAQDTVIGGKEPANSNIQTHIGTVTGNPHAVTKALVGLGSADDTSDADKPISTATQAALDALSSGHTIQNPAGTPMTDRPNLQFVGDVAVSDDGANSRTVVDVTGSGGGGDLTRARVAPTSGLTVASLDTRHMIDLSGLTADWTLELPAGTVDGQQVEWEVTGEAPTTRDMIVAAATGVTVAWRGTDYVGSSVTEYYLGGELGAAVWDQTEGKWRQCSLGQESNICELQLSTDCSGEASNTYTNPVSEGGTWAKGLDNASLGNTALGRIQVRRSGSYAVSALVNGAGYSADACTLSVRVIDALNAYLMYLRE